MPRYNAQSELPSFVKIRPAKLKRKDADKARKRKGKSEYARNSKSGKLICGRVIYTL